MLGVMDEAVTIYMYIDTPGKVYILLFIIESIAQPRRDIRICLMKYLLSGVSVFILFEDNTFSYHANASHWHKSFRTCTSIMNK